MIHFINQTNMEIQKEILDFLNIIKNDICNNEVELVVVNSDEIRRLNREFLGKDYETDVLSFGLDYSGIKLPNPPLGSIIISIDSAINVSKQYKHSLRDEFAILFVHSLLHLLGYDHEIDDGEHRQKEIDILKQYNIFSPLIQRSLESCK
ncbi:rRNA maturation RNase YbeY [Helicobacter sp. 16-1353]|uniref:rRNA maturation RNase YbeY n=1 Tax=Helicobacter sp. 16-1353 TaxID=2004996 RepID=UPI000DCC8E62|nr:rRNA maturation RNase YbeY [Helicobacter sp. 16-1353]RAX53202.1 rRNA maturation RNase YbeY [Helicobacter sp. 16-1353]